MTRNPVVQIALVLSILLGGPVLAWAIDFRVESLVFQVKKKEPISSSITLFHAGVVYDFLASASRVAVFDKPRGRFILLDTEQKHKVELKLEQVVAFSNNIQAMASKSHGAFMQFMAHPTFEINSDKESGELVFSSPSITYRIRGLSPPASESVNQYREFSDWYARLNTLTSPGSPPPFARLVVNEELAHRNQVPEHVQMTIPQQLQLGGRGLSLHSEHRFTWRLLQKDLDQIAVFGEQMATFSTVSLAEYRKSSQP